MATKKLNSHQLLRDYHSRSDYAQIAQAAAAWVRAHPGAARADLLAWAVETYGAEEKLEMAHRHAPLTLFGDVGTQIPHNAVEQMQTVLRLPMAQQGALMPDAHLGYAMPIGGVASLAGAVSPSFVGYDISCMVQLTLLDIPPDELRRAREHFAQALRDVTSFGLGSDFAPGEREHAVMDEPLWREIPILSGYRSLAQSQLGSSGGGNHFADLVTVSFLQAEGDQAAGAERVGLLTHSGSRGTGHKLATHYVKRAERETVRVARAIPRGYEWLALDSELGREYLAVMELMGCYARANHDLIHDHFMAAAQARQLLRIWNRHNYAWVDGENAAVLHRKGATPAARGQLGLIPGSSGTPSYVVRGLGNPESLSSSAHGAGRYFSRTEAKRRHDERAFRRHMARRQILHFGLAPDETFLAYKDIEMVMSLQDGILIEPVARMTPHVVVMGGKADDGD